MRERESKLTLKANYWPNWHRLKGRYMGGRNATSLNLILKNAKTYDKDRSRILNLGCWPSGRADYKHKMLPKLRGGTNGWTRGLGEFCFFWVIFSKNFKHQVQGICGQVHWLKKPMLACGKNMPRNNHFSVFWLRKGKILPRKIICPTFFQNLPKKTIFAHSPSPAKLPLYS